MQEIVERLVCTGDKPIYFKRTSAESVKSTKGKIIASKKCTPKVPSKSKKAEKLVKIVEECEEKSESEDELEIEKSMYSNNRRSRKRETIVGRAVMPARCVPKTY